jgi:hypothetical protein
VKDEILAAAEVAGRNGNVYCIGSFGRRVNFYAQQNRALNLVWALKEAGRIRSGNSIAVIGGGVTGLTAAAGLISLGCSVDIYESGAVAIPRQAATQHRLVHPTINAWPSKAPEITTQLPFLEWHVGQCDQIAVSLKEQFESMRGAGSRLIPNIIVTDIFEVATDLVMVRPHPEEGRKSYRLAIIALGFGDEVPSASFPGGVKYWSPDGLEIDRNNNKFDHYIISGCGDGGLIDALRIVHYDFGAGLLAFETAAELYGTPLAEDIESAEAAEDPDPVRLESAYAAAAELLRTDPRYERTHQRLMKSLSRFRQLVVLTDTKWSPPFSPNAAPIHKLLVAHARRDGRIKYMSGEVALEESCYRVKGQPFSPIDKTRVVVRHGADARAALVKILTIAEIDDLELKQRRLSDHLGDRVWQPYPAGGGFPQQDPTSDDFIDHRQPAVEALLQWINKKSKLVRVANGFEVTFPEHVPAIMHGPLFGIQTSAYRKPLIKAIP